MYVWLLLRCVCLCVYVSVHVCMLWVCACVWACVWMCICCVYVCIYASSELFMHACIHVYLRIRVCTYVCMHVCVYVCMHVCVYIYIYTHTHVYTHTYTYSWDWCTHACMCHLGPFSALMCTCMYDMYDMYACKLTVCRRIELPWSCRHKCCHDTFLWSFTGTSWRKCNVCMCAPVYCICVYQPPSTNEYTRKCFARTNVHPNTHTLSVSVSVSLLSHTYTHTHILVSGTDLLPQRSNQSLALARQARSSWPTFRFL